MILLELCFAIAIIGIILTAFLSVNQLRLRQQRIEKTNQALALAQASLENFFQEHNRYPCPATAIPGPDGRLSYKEENCTKVIILSSKDIHSLRGYNDKIVSVGLLPSRTLGLSEKFVTDGWGTHITYAISQALAKADRQPGENRYDAAAINLIDRNGELIIAPPPLYLLISHGPNQTGAWGAEGFSNSCQTNTYEGENCDMDGTFRLEPYAEAQGPQYFDDIVVHDRDILHPGNDEIGKKMLQDLFICQQKSAFYDPDDSGADENGCVGRALPSGSCSNNLVMRGVDKNGQISCVPNMNPGLCRGGEILLGYDENGNIICSDLVMKMLACAQIGMIYAGAGANGANVNGCVNAVQPPSAP